MKRVLTNKERAGRRGLAVRQRYDGILEVTDEPPKDCPMEMIKFGSDDLENRLAEDPSRAELLPFGAIMVDHQGKILRFNQVESGISGRSSKDVVGKNFFNDIAPCAKGQVFYNHFFQAVGDGQVNTMFDYHFDYKMTPVNVRIHMKSANASQGIWIFIKRV